jgi:hypothetical protein
MGVTSFLVGIPTATHRIAEDWRGQLINIGIPPPLADRCYGFLRVIAFFVIVFGLINFFLWIWILLNVLF